VLEESRRQSDSTTSRKSAVVPLAALAACRGLSFAALSDYLPGSLIDASSSNLPFFATLSFGVVFSGSCNPYTPAQVLRDAGAAIVTLAGASAFVKLCTDSVKTGRFVPRDARKIIHTLSAPLFVFCWPFFSDALGARAFASIVPFLMAVRLVVAGSSNSSESADSSSEVELAEAISRSGDAKEALGGPFVYVLVMIFSTLVFWRDNPVGTVSVATMACGDGLADLLGRRFGASNKWSFNKSKSVAGSAALVAGSVAGSYGLIAWLTKTGAMLSLGLSTGDLLLRLLAVATVCAFVELFPVVDDNISVPVSAAFLSQILLPTR